MGWGRRRLLRIAAVITAVRRALLDRGACCADHVDVAHIGHCFSLLVLELPGDDGDDAAGGCGWGGELVCRRDHDCRVHRSLKLVC